MINKKLLKKSLISFVMLFSLHAEIAQAVFYLKANIGASALSNVKINNRSSELKNLNIKGDLSSTVKNVDGAFVGLGVGIDLIEGLRLDVTFEKFLKSNSKGEFKAELPSKGVIDIANKLENDISMLMVNSFIDFYESSLLKFFIGGGIGVSKVESKLSTSYSSSEDLPSLLGKSSPNSQSYSVTQRYNLALAGYLGASAEFLPGVVAELMYSYRDMGKSGKIDELDQSIIAKGHNVIIGLRYGI